MLPWEAISTNRSHSQCLSWFCLKLEHVKGLSREVEQKFHMTAPLPPKPSVLKHRKVMSVFRNQSNPVTFTVGNLPSVTSK